MCRFTLLKLERVDSDDVKTRAPNVVVEIVKGCSLIFECDDIFGR